ncbi:MAG: DNA recombination protein RmuC [Chitinivibrionia bacterium]|nr:DNA recombination protein RmuC [Chitinivibrionia bacterium]
MIEALFLILGILIGGGAMFFALKSKSDASEKLNEQMKLQFENSEKLNEQMKLQTEKLNEQMKLQFENTANKILEEKSKKFVEINEEKIDNILKPLGEKLGEFQRKVEDTYSTERAEKASLRKELEQIVLLNNKLTDEANKLTKALKGDSKVQGDWGEFQLEVLLEKSGLVEGVNFQKQQNFKTDENANIRPDFVINLPENKHYVIDSKVSLTAYEQYFNGEDEIIKEKALKEHISSVKKHIDELSDKKYEQIFGINSPDFVFMFVPLEPALTIAVAQNSALLEYALKKNVMLVVPTTLMFAMRTVAYIWKVEKQNKNVQEIAKVGGQLYDKFVGFSENMIKVGQTMDSAKKTYGEAMNQLVKRNSDGSTNAATILGQVENLKKMGANATKQINQNLLERIEE